jgi:glycogen debranching enzyme
VPGGRVSACVTGPGRIDVNFRSCLCRYRFASLRGAIANRTAIRGSEGPGIIIEAGADAAPWELAVDEFGSAWEARDRLPFDQARDEGVVAFESFCGRLAPVPPGWEQARRLAGYIFWSCTKGLSGYFQREPVFMSLNWMDGVWSWDNVFNAVALASGHPELAFDQLMLMADNQDDLGAYPDRVDEFVRHYNYSKPPVHGVLLRELERINPGWWTPARTCTVVDSVARSTQWWLDHRVWPGRSLAHYLHGNDSGWDNTTLLLSGAPLEAPDLNAFLAVQAGWLADKEMQLGRKRRSAHWRSVEERLAREVVAQLWRGRQFIGRKLPGDEEIRSRSLVDCMPVVMGRRLPHDVARAVIRRIRTFMTPVGLATEQPDSPHYKDDGYWRGPVWGASTYLIVLGLESLGEHRLACSLARRFCKTCVRSGFAENFDALTGASRRDPAYTWTAGVFLLLASRCISESRRA